MRQHLQKSPSQLTYIFFKCELKASLKVLVPGLQAAKEPGVHLRIHRLANLAMVLATLQKERVPHLEKIVADEVYRQACSSHHQIRFISDSVKSGEVLNKFC